MLVLIASGLLAAPLPQSPSPDAAAVALFDGKTLQGWSGQPGVWSVQDGCIVGSTYASRIEKNTFLVWQGGEFADFTFECEVRIEGGNNSGIQYRSVRPDPADWTISGYQFDVHPEPALFGELYDEGGRGFLARRGEQVVVDAEGKVRVVGKVSEQTPADVHAWHRFQLTARGTHLRHVVDGVVTAECDDQWRGARRSGLLALQMHAGEPMRVWFRNLRLVRLPTEEVAQQPQPAAPPQWIWDEQAQDGEEVFFRREFTLAGEPKGASLAITCDNHCRVYLNGEQVGHSDAWESPLMLDVRTQLKPGANVLAVHGWNEGTIAGLCAKLSWQAADGARGALVTDASWRCFADDPDGWNRTGFDDAAWPKARVIAALGQPNAPWTSALGADAFDEASAELTLPPPQPASELTLAQGWSAQRLLRVPRRMGSWVALAKDPQGRLYASDQGKGLYRLTLGAGSAVTAIDKVDVDLDGCHGLLWAHDCLYAVVNSGRSGLYRLRDTDGDDRLDRVELLRKLDGEGEHGPHSILLDPDGEHLLVLCGNHTKPPELAASRLPRNWAEDQLLPRIDDPNGHAVGVMAPGGYLCRVDRDGKEWELIASGFRNAFDFAVAPDGEIYAYDADMEWDMGLPWYRPTRVCHCVSGAEFGWRNGSGKWPADYPDSLPPVCDIGPGSPTGVLYTGGAMYCLDWTFGTIYEVTPTGSGASAVAAPRPVVTGQPFPLTDAIEAPGGDGMYVLTGGRGLPSTLYHIRPPAVPRSPKAAPFAPGAEPRALRRSLEAFHGHADGKAVAFAWPQLGSADPFLRYAARLAIEWQPVAEWRERALAEQSSPWAALTALLALARQGEAADQPALLAALARIPLASLDPLQQVAWTRVHALSYARMGRPTGAVRDALAARLLAAFPTGVERTDIELCGLLSMIDEAGVIEKALPRMLREGAPPPPPWASLLVRNENYGGVIQRMMRDMPPAPQICYALALRNVAHGWTLSQRESFFAFLKQARTKVGGASYGGYLGRIWSDAMATCTEAERAALAPVAGEKLPTPPPFRATPPKGPGRDWQLDEAVAAAKRGLTGRDFASGHNLYFATSCAACHRFAGEGGSVGPDLSSLGAKFGAADVLEAILLPSKVISDQYAGVVLTRKDGTSVFGRFQRSKREGAEFWTGIEATAEAKRVEIPVADVAKVEPSRVSPMPTGLIQRLSEDELLDLLAFLLSRGDDKGPMFRR